MKTILTIVVFACLLITGCNSNKTESDSESQDLKDTIVSTLADLSASTDVRKLLCQNWENKDDAEEAALSGGGEGLEQPYRGFSFFADSTVVENPRDNIRFGKWSMNDADKLIHIVFDGNVKKQYKIAAIGARQMILLNMTDKQKIVYRADAKVQQDILDDPFYSSNNLWRIKPKQSETDDAIQSRTEQCVQFYAKFLADNAGRGANIISFAGLPSCFKWYRGGISVTNKDKLETKWLNCFYSKEQALKGHAMLEKIISKKYKWNKKERDWVRQSADVMKQMYDTLKVL